MRNVSSIAKRVLAGVAVAGTAVALSAAPAFAGDNAHAQSTSEECGLISCITVEHSEAWFYHDGDDWKICDTYGDGHRAKMSVYWSDSSGNHIHYLSATGGEGDCVSGGAGVNIPEGQRVTLKVWHQNGADGSPQDVDTDYGTA
ncbi:hypothetical protein ACIPJS_30250 [Streptomyces sp. NPDC086783]|uniref:hypothetical protein n=1 Tax=Streptomyces sp. NPDC086783 TaxID=3365758 RepID=UPI00382160CC